MNQRAIVVAIIIFALIIVGMFIFAYLERSGVEESQQQEQEPITEEERPKPQERITAKHFFEDGKHTLAGEIAMPTPCDLLDVSAAVIGGESSRANISFDVINNSEGQCAQVVTTQRFKVSFNAPQNIEMVATFRGEEAILNLIEAGEDEDPDDFKLFIKG